ncbi:tRNA1(Val) (adenine(37)-N6)-methyltransferase [Yunchengibacter salinarum]|uniref:tRNA1(Val) (adenine(37)-N6)-methyltransferase n=1 Tax=Yunchengibacter salinarum TaxID=3133399 RepID=UPI0035B5A0E4
MPESNPPETSTTEKPDRRAGARDITMDAFLGGALHLEQPIDGYRVSMDTVMLAAAVPAQPGETVLEGGIGSGGAALCLARRVPDVRVHGIDVQQSMIDLATRNAQRNGLGHALTLALGDVADRSGAQSQYDHVMLNPPYLAHASAIRPPDRSKGMAHMESRAVLDDWLRFAVHYVRQKGSITLVYRADRLDEVLARLHGRVGAISVLPLWPRQGEAAKRVIIQGRKGARGGLTLLPGLALHGRTERYTPEAENILRKGAALDLAAPNGKS